jgi:putative hemolysin
MMMTKGRYDVRLAKTEVEIKEAQSLRQLCFQAKSGTDAADADYFDARFHHVLIRDCRTDRLVCTYRFSQLKSGQDISESYSAQYYDLSRLKAFAGPMVELGRFCIHPQITDPDIVRIAWAAMTQYVDANGIDMLFGCTSFSGTDPQAYLDSFTVLRDRHLAPSQWKPNSISDEIFHFNSILKSTIDVKKAMTRMPTILRSYLAMGGWVSDHAVVDRHLNTLHVFTGLEVRAIPEPRKRLLRAVAGKTIRQNRD